MHLLSIDKPFRQKSTERYPHRLVIATKSRIARSLLQSQKAVALGRGRWYLLSISRSISLEQTLLLKFTETGAYLHSKIGATPCAEITSQFTEIRAWEVI